MNDKVDNVIAYKGFDKNWQCRGFQYEVGKTYHHDGKVEICSSGFHACQYPLNVFDYYKLTQSKYAEVELKEPVAKHEYDTKIASATITIKAELSIHDMVKRAIKWIMGRVDSTVEEGEEFSIASSTWHYSAASNTGNYSAASSTGNYSAASSTGYRSAVSSTGDCSVASSTGNYSAASSTGNRSAVSSTGYRSAVSSTGYQSVVSSTGYCSAVSSIGNRSAVSSTGDFSAASNIGHHSVASSTGYRSAVSVEGKASVAMATGEKSKAKACKGSAIVLCNYGADGNLRHIRSSKVGENGIEADTWYTLNNKGEFVEVNDD